MQKVLVTILLATACLSTSLPAVATEQVRKAEESQSFFERYTNAAQDVILQGLKLVGVRYRLGGNDEDSGLDCSGFVRLVFKDSIGALLPRTAAEMSESRPAHRYQPAQTGRSGVLQHHASRLLACRHLSR
jgi:cell wall-associated NlpC family hydrolase